MNEPEIWKSQDTSHGDVSESAALMEGVLYEVKKVVVGQDAFLERIMIAMLSGVTCSSKACRGLPRP